MAWMQILRPVRLVRFYKRPKLDSPVAPPSTAARRLAFGCHDCRGSKLAPTWKAALPAQASFSPADDISSACKKMRAKENVRKIGSPVRPSPPIFLPVRQTLLIPRQFCRMPPGSPMPLGKPITTDLRENVVPLVPASRVHGGGSIHCFLLAVPSGTKDNSPAIYCLGFDQISKKSRQGRQKNTAERPFCRP